MSSIHGKISSWRFEQYGQELVAPHETKPKTDFKRKSTSTVAYAPVCPHCHLVIPRLDGVCDCGYVADNSTQQCRLVTEPNVKYKDIKKIVLDNVTYKVETMLKTKKAYVYELVDGLDNKKHWSYVTDLTKLVKVLKNI